MTPPAIALTIGDPNGIGPEIAIKAAAELAREGGPPVVLVGDEFVLRFYAELCAKAFALRNFDGQGAPPGTLQFLAVDFCRGMPSIQGRPWPLAGARPSSTSLRRCVL